MRRALIVMALMLRYCSRTVHVWGCFAAADEWNAREATTPKPTVYQILFGHVQMIVLNNQETKSMSLKFIWFINIRQRKSEPVSSITLMGSSPKNIEYKKLFLWCMSLHPRRTAGPRGLAVVSVHACTTSWSFRSANHTVTRTSYNFPPCSPMYYRNTTENIGKDWKLVKK